jgi:2,4-dienoyl-CoA reductase-like NADH-dependent reductase (Old Yellow Enzyme family)
MLFSPFKVRDVEFRNRVVISPMCQYSAVDGHAGDWHLVHLGQFALGGAGAVLVEATAIQERGRITHGDVGLWKDSQVEPLARIVQFLRRHGSRAGIQLGHAGRKASSQAPWHGNGPLTEQDMQLRGEAPWETISSGSQPMAPDWHAPRPMPVPEIDELVEDWARAAERADRAGFDFLEIHAAHGYLLHQYLSPLCNDRTDSYGGSLANRMRLTIRVAQAVRRAWPAHKPLFARLSVVDGGDGNGWGLEDSITLARELQEVGVDVIDCSSSGLGGPATAATAKRGLGFQVQLAAEVKRRTPIATMAVGLIVDPWQADDVLRQGNADFIAIGREALADPRWPARAEMALRDTELADFTEWPHQYGWWLARRERILSNLGMSSRPQRRVAVQD